MKPENDLVFMTWWKANYAKKEKQAMYPDDYAYAGWLAAQEKIDRLLNDVILDTWVQAKYTGSVSVQEIINMNKIKHGLL